MTTHSIRERRTAWMLCAAIFITFCLAYLIGSQAELLATAQWVLSDHHTQYMPVLTPVLLTLIFTVVAWGVWLWVKPSAATTAFAFAPSAWLLGLITNVTLPVADGVSNGFSCIGFTIAFFVIALWLTILRRMTLGGIYSRSSSTPFMVMANTAVMVLLLAFSAWAGNTRAHIHHTLRMSTFCSTDDMDGLLRVGVANPECNRSMCAMRAYALSRQNQLGERLFCFPQHHGALGLVPPFADSSYIVNWPQVVSRHLRACYYKDVETSNEAIHYLRRTLELHPGRKQADYLLCAYLLERRLDDFAEELVKHYALNDSLPKHYKEALAVYQRRTQEPAFTYHNAETEGLLAELLACKAQYQDKTAQEFHIVDMYHETYWCYYYYTSGSDKLDTF